MDSKDKKKTATFFLYYPDTLSNLNSSDVLSKLDYAVPGNDYAKKQLLSTINQAYINRDLGQISAIMLNGNSGVGKSSLIRSLADSANIPLVRFDLELILDTAETTLEKVIKFPIFDELYFEKDDATPFSSGEKKVYDSFLKQFSGIDEKNISTIHQRVNSDFTIIEFDNSEILVNNKYGQNKSINSLQLALVDLLKKPFDVTVAPLDSSNHYPLYTSNFIYIFSSDLSKNIRQANVGFRIKNKLTDCFDSNILVDLGYSKKFVDLLNPIISLKDLTEQDFEKYLSKNESHLHESIKGLEKNYEIKISLDPSAIKVVSKYLVENKKNLRGIEDVTRKLLAPQYLSPVKGTKVVIDSAVAKERLYS